MHPTPLPHSHSAPPPAERDSSPAGTGTGLRLALPVCECRLLPAPSGQHKPFLAVPANLTPRRGREVWHPTAGQVPLGGMPIGRSREVCGRTCSDAGGGDWRILFLPETELQRPRLGGERRGPDSCSAWSACHGHSQGQERPMQGACPVSHSHTAAFGLSPAPCPKPTPCNMHRPPCGVSVWGQPPAPPLGWEGSKVMPAAGGWCYCHPAI